MIEGLAKKIGYNKVRAFTASGDPLVLKPFIAKTGLTAHIYVSSEPFTQNNVTAVPVTIIETKDGKRIRFEGMTDNFIGQPGLANDVVPVSGQVPSQGAQGGKQCRGQ